MEREWYYVRQGEQRGPLTTEEMTQMIADQEIAASDLVWKASMGKWEPAVQRAEFFRQPEEPAPSSAGQEWYCSTAGGRVGPISIDALRQMFVSGQAGPEDLVWSDGMIEWQPAGNLPVFFGQGAGAATAGWEQEAYAGTPAMLNYHTPQKRVAYAGFWLRFCAAFLDGIIIFAIQFGLSFAVALAVAGRVDEGLAMLLNLVGFIIAWLYAALQESSPAQATLGKRALGIKVTDIKGEPIGFGRATGRHFGKIVSWLILWIGFIIAAFTQRKQALHDMMADCLVVRRR